MGGLLPGLLLFDGVINEHFFTTRTRGGCRRKRSPRLLLCAVALASSDEESVAVAIAACVPEYGADRWK